MYNIDVIIPTYNRGHIIERAVNSVLNQTIGFNNLIIVDDGSTDNTNNILSQYNDKIKYLYTTHKGVSHARNTGIEFSNSKYITFLDSDDEWIPQKLEREYKFLAQNPEYKVIYTNEIWYRNRVRVNQKKKHKKYSGNIYEHCLPLCIISPSSVMIERSVLYDIGLFNIEFPVCEDYDLWLRISSKYKIKFLNENLIIKYGGHDDQLSKSRWGFDIYRIISMINILKSNKLTKEQTDLTIYNCLQKLDIAISGYQNRNKKDYAYLLRIIYKKIEAQDYNINKNKLLSIL